MTTLEAMTNVSQILLRANGRWHTEGLDDVLRRDIAATVHDVAQLFRDDAGDPERLVSIVVAELERRAG